MLYISTSKIRESTVGASFTVTFSVAPDEIDYLTALREKYAEMNMCGFTIKPSDSEKPNNSTCSKMEQVDKDTNVRSKDCETCIWSVCNYSKVPWGKEEEPHTCETCKHWEHGAHSHFYCARLEMRQECHYEPKTEPQITVKQTSPRTEAKTPYDLKTEPQKCYLRKSCDHYGDKQVCGRCREYNLYSHTKDEPQTDCAWKKGGD